MELIYPESYLVILTYYKKSVSSKIDKIYFWTLPHKMSIVDFFNKCCEKRNDILTSSYFLFQKYKEWCELEHVKCLFTCSNDFEGAMRRHGFGKGHIMYPECLVDVDYVVSHTPNGTAEDGAQIDKPKSITLPDPTAPVPPPRKPLATPIAQVPEKTKPSSTVAPTTRIVENEDKGKAKVVESSPVTVPIIQISKKKRKTEGKGKDTKKKETKKLVPILRDLPWSLEPLEPIKSDVDVYVLINALLSSINSFHDEFDGMLINLAHVDYKYDQKCEDLIRYKLKLVKMKYYLAQIEGLDVSRLNESLDIITYEPSWYIPYDHHEIHTMYLNELSEYLGTYRGFEDLAYDLDEINARFKVTTLNDPFVARFKDAVSIVDVTFGKLKKDFAKKYLTLGMKIF